MRTIPCRYRAEPRERPVMVFHLQNGPADVRLLAHLGSVGYRLRRISQPMPTMPRAVYGTAVRDTEMPLG
jgi:hypothetical protein